MALRSSTFSVFVVFVVGMSLMSQLPCAFLPAGAPRQAQTEVVAKTGMSMRPDTLALGAAAGVLAAQPAHGFVFLDEAVPYALVTSGAILYGIFLGFVLLRLQEAFPE